MSRLGTSQLRLSLHDPLPGLPDGLSGRDLALSAGGTEMTYRYDSAADDNGIASLMRQLDALGIGVRNLHTHQSTLEEIFVSLMRAQS